MFCLTFKEYVIDSPTSINCGLYSNVEIPCTLIGQPGTFRAWYHYRKSLIVRTLAGTMSDDTNTLALKSCRAEDAGDYVCVWNISKPFSITVNGSTSMTVNGKEMVYTCFNYSKRRLHFLSKIKINSESIYS